MGKPFQGRTLLALLPVTIIFIIGAILLNSCGQGNPAGSSPSQSATTPAPKTPTSSVPLLSASSTATGINITVNGIPGKNYHLYMADSTSAVASTAARLPDGNITHVLKLDPSKTYYFILGETDSKGNEHFSGTYVISKPSASGKGREDILETTPPLDDSSQSASPSSGGHNGLNALAGINPYVNLPYGGGLSVYVDYAAAGGVLPNLHISEQSGGHFRRYGGFSNTFLGKQGGHPEVQQSVCSAYINGVLTDYTCWLDTYRWWTYNSPLEGRWDYYSDKYANPYASGLYIISATYLAYPEPLHSFWGKPYFAYTARSCGKVVASGAIALPPGNDPMGEDHMTPQVFVRVPSSCDNKKLTKISISPSQATAYIHPPANNPASGTAQFTATGDYSDNTTQDITSSATWSSSDSTVANVNAGLAIPQKSGTCQISATQDGVKSSDPPGILTVKCRQWTYFRQGDYFQEYDHWINRKTRKPVTIGAVGCALTSLAMILKSTGQDFDPNILNNVFNIGYDPIPNRSLGFDGHSVKWGIIDTISGGIVTIGQSSTTDVFAQPINISIINQYVDQCKPVIVGVRRLSNYSNPNATHYVLVTGREGFTYHILDPAWPSVTTLDTYQNTIYAYIVYNINQ